MSRSPAHGQLYLMSLMRMTMHKPLSILLFWSFQLIFHTWPQRDVPIEPNCDHTVVLTMTLHLTTTFHSLTCFLLVESVPILLFMPPLHLQSHQCSLSHEPSNGQWPSIPIMSHLIVFCFQCQLPCTVDKVSWSPSLMPPLPAIWTLLATPSWASVKLYGMRVSWTSSDSWLSVRMVPSLHLLDISRTAVSSQ